MGKRDVGEIERNEEAYSGQFKQTLKFFVDTIAFKVFLAYSLVVSAREIYVAKNGSVAGDGSLLLPYETLGKAVSVATAGSGIKTLSLTLPDLPGVGQRLQLKTENRPRGAAWNDPGVVASSTTVMVENSGNRAY